MILKNPSEKLHSKNIAIVIVASALSAWVLWKDHVGFKTDQVGASTRQMDYRNPNINPWGQTAKSGSTSQEGAL